MDDDRRDRLVALVETDYTTTRELIDGVVRTSVELRPVGMTAIVALLGFAVSEPNFALALGGLVATTLFGLLDAYHGALYAQALDRANGLERLLRLRYKALEQGREEAIETLDAALAGHRFGQYLDLDPVNWEGMLNARPRVLLAVLYGSLALFSLGAMANALLT